MSTTLSCAQCDAPLRPGQDWCSLCFAPVEPSFDPLTAPLEEVVGRAEAPELPVGEPVNEAASALSTVDVRLDRSGESLPVLGLHEPVETSDRGPVAEVSDIDVMLSMLAAEHRQSDPAAGIAERLSDRSTRVAVMVGGTALIGALVFLVLTILGALV